MTSGVNKLQGCIFVGHTNTDCDRCARDNRRPACKYVATLESRDSSLVVWAALRRHT